MIEKQTNIKVKSKFIDELGKIILVQLNGYLDQTNSDYIQKVFDEIYHSECYNVIFDMGELDYISSAGWGIIVGEVARFRAMGGDIKLIRMTPEVYRIFEMLEFYHILESYDDLDNCLKSLNISNQKETENSSSDSKKLKIAKDLIESKETGASKEKKSSEPKLGKKNSSSDAYLSEVDVLKILTVNKRIIPLEKMPIQEKIKKIISEYPFISIYKIKKILQHKKFGREKVNIIKLYFILKNMNLETKEKRFRFFRSI
jgi:anti-anti-sigma factor